MSPYTEQPMTSTNCQYQPSVDSSPDLTKLSTSDLIEDLSTQCGLFQRSPSSGISRYAWAIREALESRGHFVSYHRELQYAQVFYSQSHLHKDRDLDKLRYVIISWKRALAAWNAQINSIHKSHDRMCILSRLLVALRVMWERKISCMSATSRCSTTIEMIELLYKITMMNGDPSHLKTAVQLSTRLMLAVPRHHPDRVTVCYRHGSLLEAEIRYGLVSSNQMAHQFNPIVIAYTEALQLLNSDDPERAHPSITCALFFLEEFSRTQEQALFERAEQLLRESVDHNPYSAYGFAKDAVKVMFEAILYIFRKEYEYIVLPREQKSSVSGSSLDWAVDFQAIVPIMQEAVRIYASGTSHGPISHLRDLRLRMPQPTHNRRITLWTDGPHMLLISGKYHVKHVLEMLDDSHGLFWASTPHYNGGYTHNTAHPKFPGRIKDVSEVNTVMGEFDMRAVREVELKTQMISTMPLNTPAHMPWEELRHIADEGVVVVLFGSPNECDAVIIPDSESEPVGLYLPSVTGKALREWSRVFYMHQSARGSEEGEDTCRKMGVARSSPHLEDWKILKQLWCHVVRPIFQKLNLEASGESLC
jgi:hypothetical protein